MNRSFLFLVSACALPWLIHERSLAEALHSPIVNSKKTSGRGTVGMKVTENYSGGSEYYVDCGAPKMEGDGRSPATAWNSLVEVNGHSFVPGDVIYLKRGTECHGLLWPKGSGSASASIRLTTYGKGSRPMVIASMSDEEAFKLFDQEYWEVDSIDFSGGRLFGVFVSGQTGILHHIHIKNLLVHDVHGGEVKHKESGLVVISPGSVQQHFDDVLVEGVTAYDTDQWAGILVGGGNFGEVSEEDWSIRVIVRGSVVHDVYGDGIILFRIKNGLIDSSAAWHTGMQPTQSIGTPNAIWTWMCKNCVVSNNEAFLTDSPGVDGGAFDIDYGNTLNSVVGNYGHDTQGYCIAVFGAGYVTRESVVQGNLCINNGKSPRLARRQGAIYLWTWNNGIIEDLRVEKNIIYWSPNGNFPALLNHGDIRGSQRTFRENRIYSGSSWIIDSDRNMNFQENQYVICGSYKAKWCFGGHTYTTLGDYRDGAHQEQGSGWKSDLLSASCLSVERPHFEESTNVTLANKNGASAHSSSSPGWTIVSELPVSVDAYGLVDAKSAGQLVVLKNLNMQFRPSGLRAEVKLLLKHASTKQSMQNVIHDLAVDHVEVSEATAGEFPSHPTTRLVAPDGSIAKEWQGFVGPAEIGLAVRKVLGMPLYSQMRSAEQ